MGAELENQYWKLRKTDGKPKRFETPETFLTEANKYFEWVKANPWIKKDFIKSGQDAGKIVEIETQRPYTIEGLCLFLGINYQTFLNYEKDEKYKDYFEAFAYVRGIVDNQHLEGGYVGAFNPMLVARKLKLKEQTETTGNVNHSVTQINFVQRNIEDTTHEDVTGTDY